MHFSVETDDFGRMVCTISDGTSTAVVTAVDLGDAVASLMTAIDRVVENGVGECFWSEGVGEYRWVFRRVDDMLRIAVLWSTGTLTGWEHVFFAECKSAGFIAAARAELARAATPTRT